MTKLKEDWRPKTSDMKDEKGRYIVQGLFLEDSYNSDLAVYTLKGDHHEYKGKVFPSLKKLYLEEGDPNEYMFAEKYLVDWPHWQRLVKNKWLSPHIESWRDELILSLRSEGIASIIDLALNHNHYQAAKYLADEGWVKNERGRPSQAEIDGEVARRATIEEQHKEAFQLLQLHQGGKS